MNTAVIKALGRARNEWVWSFARTSLRISRAIVQGDIDTMAIEAFPLGAYDVEACRAMANAAGMRLALSADEVRTELGLGCECEDVEIAIEAIRGLADGSIGTYEEQDTTRRVWLLYQENLDECETTIDEVRQAVHGIGVRGAAELIVAADDWFRGRVTS